MPTERIPLSQPIETRDGTLTKDSECVNGYFETVSGKRDFVKRPGFTVANLTPAIPAGEGQGLTFFNGFFYAIVNNVLYKINPSTYAVTTVGTITGTLANCYFAQTLNNGYLFFHNQTNGYLLNGSTGVLSQITNDKVATVTILTGGSGYTNPIVTFSAPPSGVTATGTVQLTSGVVTGVTITNPGLGYVIAPTVTISDSGGGTGSGATANCLLNFFPTGGITPGAVFLDTYIAVTTLSGRTYTSNVGDPTIWNPLDYITAEAEPDNSVGECKHLNYILNFGQWSTEFFYDAANLTGSPLSSAPAYRLEIGCANGDSIVSFEQTVAWIGTSRTVGTGVYIIDGTAPVRVSTPFIERLLGNSTLQTVRAYAFKFNGHMFYVLSLHDINTTVVYDMNEKVWTQWTMWSIGNPDTGAPATYGEQYFRPSFFAGNGLQYFALDDDTGQLYIFSDMVYNDAGAPIYYRAVTDRLDSGTTKRKFYHRVEIIGDKVPATMKIRHSDDDYKTWSNYRSVDLNKSRSQILQAGAARRRAWEFLCTDNVPLRLDAAEIDFSIGDMENEGVQPTNYRK